MTATTAPPAEKTAAPAPAKKSKKKLLIIAVVLLLGLGGAGYFFVLKPGSGGDAAPKPGPVAPLDHVQINLAQGHYLRLGLSLQLTDAVSGEHGGEFDGSKALDAAIEIFSGRDVAELAKDGQRAKLKKELVKVLEERYEGEVMDVYFTEFVTE
ncbi:flagellar basal body-associated FliL family protein [Nocardioides humilatus]|uniref:Flagellar protein FliL n=1 Tax=Nocardioides humilatus TaxID=2607660 RepID=A0A5B1LAN3_9ACTN|nr:flagellar basal body-associated FliL family protein [Nocardioides humilatus]KAA1417695.1 flagellar basal body-associated FliL family protein [Nocardioides humilatus]